MLRVVKPSDPPTEDAPPSAAGVNSAETKFMPQDAAAAAASELFRKEVFVYQTRRLQGEVLIGAGPLWLILGYAMVAVVVAGLLFVSLLSYARTETVTGWLVPRGGIVRLTAEQGGIVERFFVSEGQDVKAGAALVGMRLSRDSGQGDSGAVLETAARRALDAERLNAAAALDKLAVDHRALLVQAATVDAQVREGRAMLGILEQKKGLADAKLERARGLLAKGYLAPQSLDAITGEALDAAQAVAAQRNSVLAQQQSLGELRARIAQAPIMQSQARASAQTNEASLTQQLEQVRVGARYTITSPADGAVIALPANLGQSVSAGAPVAVVTAKGGPLEVELYVPSRAAGFIKVGQSVSLQYQPYPYKKFGSGQGRIVSISRAPLTPAEVGLSGFTVSEPVFRVRADLARSYIEAYGTRTPLQAGTGLEARIIIDRRSLLEWLFDPLFAVGKR